MRRIAAIVLTVVALAAGAWYLLAPADAGATVRARLQAFSDVVNSSTVDGLGPEVHSAQLGVFFTEDVDVDLGLARRRFSVATRSSAWPGGCSRARRPSG